MLGVIPNLTSILFRGVAQWSKALGLGPRIIAGSNPVSPTLYSPLVQLVERSICNPEVVGSSPAWGSIWLIYSCKYI